jgi:predicted HAD superfamily Cof-like phosphohydrolase
MEAQILKVLEFQKGLGLTMPDVPAMPSRLRQVLRQALLQEEVTEIATATELFAEGVKNEHETLVEVLDGIIDCFYILIGTAHEYGLADRLILAFDEVHRSNMSKFDEDGKAIYREDGKVIKGEWYHAPNLNQIVKKDLRAFKDVEGLKEIQAKEQQEFIAKVDDKIFELLPEKGQKNWKKFMELSEAFSKTIAIDYDFSDLLNGRKAVVTIDGEKHIIKENESLID